MKKILLISMAVAITYNVNAQSKKIARFPVNGSVLMKKDVVKNDIADPPQDYWLPIKTDVQDFKGINNTVTKIKIGTSYNSLTAATPLSTCLTANSTLNTIMLTHRQTNGATGGSGWVQSSYSTDGGATWDSTFVIYNSATYPGRYPSGVIYNPAGNTDINNAYSVICGKLLNAGAFAGNYFASERFNKTNKDLKTILYADTLTGATMQTSAIYYMSATDDGVIRVLGDQNKDDGTNYTSIKAVINKGVFNSGTNNFDWTQTVMEAPFALDAGGFPDCSSGLAGMAFSKSGEIGYLVFTGRSSSNPDPNSFCPIVYKSIDFGSTWNLTPGFNFSTIPSIDSNLHFTTDGVTKRAFFSGGNDFLVDANNNLHIATFIKSAFSNNPDSSGYVWRYDKIEGLMYDVFTTSTGWDANFIGIQFARPVPSATNVISLNNRLQMSKTPDGQKIFYVWVDSDTTTIYASDSLNRFPNVLARGYDVNGSKTAIKNFTAGSAYDGTNLHFYASDYAFKNGSTSTIHVSTVGGGGGTNDVNPATLYYLSGVTFDDAEFAPVGIVPKTSNTMSVSQNYPNPFNNTSVITVNLDKISDLSLEITNILGQKVYEKNAGRCGNGVHKFTIDGNNLQSGIYFYTVKTGENTITKKMIVE